MRTKAGMIFCLSGALLLGSTPVASAQQQTPAKELATRVEDSTKHPTAVEEKPAGTKRDETSTASPSVEDRLKAMEQLIERQQREIQTLRDIAEKKGDAAASARPGDEVTVRGTDELRAGTQPAGTKSTAGLDTIASTATPASSISVPKPMAQKNGDVPDSPLQFRIGSAYVTPVGFMDFTTVFRSATGGSGIGTNFGSIPFNNTPAGHLTESRLSAQNSRIGLRVDAFVHDAHVIGYLESDFLGAAPGNVAVSSNSDPLRLRVYWVDVTKGKFEMLGGQSWSMLTPGRKGISPIPGDLFISQDIDVNYQAGLVWSRDPQFRLVYHANDKVALGLSLEAPEQYIGGSAGGGTITLPTAINASGAYANQLDNGNTTLNVPNLHPDIIGKLALDPKLGKRDLHIEFAGLISSFKVFNPLNGKTFTSTGGGGSVNLNLELFKNFRVITNNFYSDGGGRWIFGQAPDLVIRGDGSPSLVNAASTVSGIEAQVSKNLLLYGYYGGIYIDRNAVIDPANGKPVGYGFSGSPSGQNRAIQEGTVGFTKTFWRDPKYGALQFMGQYSYLDRRPWFVAAGQPKVAHNNTILLNLRYVLPGSAPKIDNK